MNCPLCSLQSNPNETIFYQDDLVTVVRTKDLKSHAERLMVLINRHSTNPNLVERDNAKVRLIEVSKTRFQGDFYLLQDTHSRILNHWHMIASSLDPKSDDYQQMLATDRELIRK